MKLIIASLLLLLSKLTVAGELVRVENSPNNDCAEFGCMYNEWSLKGADSVRFVISGYEDGADYRFYKVAKDGQYSIILDVSPIIVDSSGKHWWGYAWDIEDIPVDYRDGKVFLHATVEHDQIRDGVFNPPTWQKRFPIIKFYGEKTQWNVEQPKTKFSLISLESLLELAK